MLQLLPGCPVISQNFRKKKKHNISTDQPPHLVYKSLCWPQVPGVLAAAHGVREYDLETLQIVPPAAMFCDPADDSFLFIPLLPFGKRLRPSVPSSSVLMPPEKNINRVYRRSSASTWDSSNYLRGRRTISRYCDDDDEEGGVRQRRKGSLARGDV